MITATANLGGTITVTAQLVSKQVGSCADATVENSDASYSTTVASGGNLVLPDTPISANGELVVSQPSGVAKNITFTVNGIAPISTTVISPSEVDLEAPAAGATLEIGVYSDAGLTTPITETNGGIVYINITTSITTPTEYRFFVSDSGTTFNFTSQAGATLAWPITNWNDLIIYAEAKDATSIAAALSAFELSVNTDIDAAAFIAAHNAITGQSMATQQQYAVDGFMRRMKGFGTTNSSDIHVIAEANTSSRIMPLVPISDSVVSLSAFALDCIHLATGNYINTLSTDASPTGVILGSGKAFDIEVAPSNFSANDMSIHVYARNTPNSMLCGSSSEVDWYITSTQIEIGGGTRSYYPINNYYDSTRYTNPATTLPAGMFSASRNSATELVAYHNGQHLETFVSAASTQSTASMYFHAMNHNLVIFRPSSTQLSLYAVLPALTTAQLADFYEAVQWLQTNVITGGRNV